MPIPLIIPIALAAASAASSIYGASKSAAANRKAQRQLDAERAQTQAERARRMNEDYIDTAAGQNMLRVARREADKIWKREQGTAAMTGATERAAMAKEYGNNMVGEAVANIAASDQQRKDNIDASYRAEERALAQQQIANEQQKGQIIAQAAAGVGSALMQAAGATFGGTKLGQSMMGNGSPGGSNVAPQGNTSTTTINDVGSTSVYDHPDIARIKGMQHYLGYNQYVTPNYKTWSGGIFGMQNINN